MRFDPYDTQSGRRRAHLEELRLEAVGHAERDEEEEAELIEEYLRSIEE